MPETTLASQTASPIYQQKLRNFSIIAHIDHGKTTLTDRFLKMTNTVSDLDFQERMMDSNPIERERGITIKLAPVRMEWRPPGAPADQPPYILNLIDTPGHVDFGYEVSRSLAACEGVLLVIDATQGVQAQTLSNYQKALDLGLTVIPVVNKIDLPSADREMVKLECMETFGVDEHDIIEVSAKTGLNMDLLLQAVVERIPAPTGLPQAPLRSLIVTSHFDQHRGAIALVRVMDGILTRGKLHFMASKTDFSPIEVGFFTPKMVKTDQLVAGEVGYVATGLKDIKMLKVGDTITTVDNKTTVQPLPGYREPTPMVYMELYPVDGDDFTLLQDAVSKLSLHDAALQFGGTHSQALGNGLRVGFLGILHAEIVLERLRQEFDLDLIATAPTVTYELVLTNGQRITIHTPGEMPDPSQIKEIHEPMTKAMVFCPERFMGQVIKLCRERRGELLNSTFIGTRVKGEFEIPLAEIITDFHDTLKSLTSGFASLEYELTGYKMVDAVKVTVLLNHEPVEALSFITVKGDAEFRGRQLAAKLKEVIPRQQFEVPIQAAIGGTVIARETLKAFRKDVTAHLYGGDVTRRQKLLKKQAKGKKKMKQIGKVELNQEAFLAVLKR
ncbi:MAG TPA: translation elongation factor 4 [Vitreimonas sp.]|nr:translation elongation factor 4 [Vitreimonas sp.]